MFNRRSGRTPRNVLQKSDATTHGDKTKRHDNIAQTGATATLQVGRPTTIPALAPHPDFARFERAMERFITEKRFVAWQGDIYRMAHPKYARPTDFIGGAGARLRGARWNPPSGPPTLYAASSPELAAEETFGLARKFGFAPRELLPRVVRAISVRVSRLIDTTDGDIRRSLNVSQDRMLETDWRRDNASGNEALTQAIGRAAAEAGLEGLIVSSAEWPEAFNLVLFMDNLRRVSWVEVVA